MHGTAQSALRQRAVAAAVERLVQALEAAETQAAVAREVEAAVARRLAPGGWHEAETEACTARARHRAARAVGRQEEEAAREARLAAIKEKEHARCKEAEARRVCTACRLRVHCMRTACALYVHCMPTLHALFLHRSFG